MLAEGAKYLGAKYVYGASTSRTDAFDCSSFTLRAFKATGISLPRTSASQAQVGTPVSLNALQKGDLVFFDTDHNGTINHVGIYAGNNTMINAATSKGVSYTNLKGNSYWEPRMVKAVRVIR
ncbi:C40 family peptidase [Bacillus megaterium]|nr:C40 family peptidase [Priestia megaterium]